MNENNENVIRFESNFGTFAYKVEYLLIEDEKLTLLPATRALLESGLANIAYRALGSKVEKALKAHLKEAYPAKRSEIPFSQESAWIIEDTARAVFAELKIPATFHVTGEYEYGENAGPKMATARKMIEPLMGTDREASIRQLAELSGMENAATADTEALIVFYHENILPKTGGKKKAKTQENPASEE